MLDWKKYEKAIFEYFKSTYPDTSVVLDKKIVGRYSKVERQIDIYIEGEIAGYPIKIVIDCKYFGSKIDVKDVESFSSMVEDVEAHQGILITHKGYSKAAINRAFYGGERIELDIINFTDLEKFQSFHVLPYSDHFAVFITAPFGWMMDLKQTEGNFPAIFPRGSTLKKSKKQKEYIYFDIDKRPTQEYTIDSVIENHNFNLLSFCSNTKFELKQLTRKDQFPSKLKISRIENSDPYVEVAGYIQYETHILIVYLLTPKELLRKNQRKLEYVLATLRAIHLSFQNEAVIQGLLNDMKNLENIDDIGRAYFQIAIWYREMDDNENSLIYFKKAFEVQPKNYNFLKRMIIEELRHNNLNDSLRYCKILFDLDPVNPTVFLLPIAIFEELGKSVHLIEFFSSLLVDVSKPKILGNIFFHLGIVQVNKAKMQ